MPKICHHTSISPEIGDLVDVTLKTTVYHSTETGFTTEYVTKDRYLARITSIYECSRCRGCPSSAVLEDVSLPDEETQSIEDINDLRWNGKTWEITQDYEEY